jgi:alpha-tubulin suppressor-like RCC1 family protein
VSVALSDNGGLPVTYTVTSNTGIIASSSSNLITVNGLTKGKPYTFTANAVNSAGAGLASNISAVIVPVTVPGSPVMANVSLVSANASVSFSTPTDNGGIPITSYTVTSSPSCITASSASSPIIVSGLTQCSSYTFTVKAINSAGNGLVSNTSSSLSIIIPYQIWSWGQNSCGQLGTGNTTNRSSPQQIGSETIWKTVSVGGSTAYAIRTDGTLWVWGYGPCNSLGIGTGQFVSSPVQIGALNTWKQVATACSDYATSAIKTDGTMWVWGRNRYGQTGVACIGCSFSTNTTSPVQIGTGNTWKAISRASYTGHAITTCGKLYSWGANFSGNLGLGNTTSYSTPKQVGALTNWASLSLTGDFAIKTDGTLWILGGDASYGQSGLGNTTNYSSPKQVGALTTWKQVQGTLSIMIGATTTCGKLFTWGYNGAGGLGICNITKYSSPKQVGALTNWSQYSGGSCNVSLAVKTDGTLWSWGSGRYGGLGLGNTTYYSSPKQVGSVTTWTKVGVGGNMAHGLRTS